MINTPPLGLPALPFAFSTQTKQSIETQSIEISLTGLRLAQRTAAILLLFVESGKWSWQTDSIITCMFSLVWGLLTL